MTPKIDKIFRKVLSGELCANFGGETNHNKNVYIIRFDFRSFFLRRSVLAWVFWRVIIPGHKFLFSWRWYPRLWLCICINLSAPVLAVAVILV